MKRWEAFLFNDELELLEARLREGETVVDRWVVLEAEQTFTGQPKPLHFAENRQQFGPWLERIEHVVASLPGGSPWDRERAQRDALASVAIDPGDLVVLADGDELVAAWAWPVLEEMTRNGTVVLPMTQHYFTLTWRTPLTLARTRAARRKDIMSFSGWADIPYQDFPALENAGWHLSCLGGPQRLSRKLQSFSHTEIADPMWVSERNCALMIEHGWDIDPHRNFELTKVEPTGPRWLVEEGVKKWPWLLTGGV